MRTTLRRVAARCADWFRNQPRLLEGALLAPWFVVACHGFVSRLGGSVANIAAAVLVMGVGIDIGRAMARRLTDRAGRWISPTAALVLAVWTACSPLLFEATARGAGWWTVDSLATRGGELAFSLAAAVATLAFPAVAVGLLWGCGSRESVRRSGLSTLVDFAPGETSPRRTHVAEGGALAGLLLGGVLAVFLLMPWIGAQPTASVCLAVLAAWRLMRWIERRSESDSAAAVSEAVRSGTPNAYSRSRAAALLPASVAFAALASAAALGRLTEQLMLSAAFLWHTRWLGLLAGVVLGARVVGATHRPTRVVGALLGFAAIWSVAAFLLFDVWTELLMWEATSISWLPALVAARAAMAAALVLPIGVAFGAVLRLDSSTDPQSTADAGEIEPARQGSSHRFVLTFAALGYFATQLTWSLWNGPVVAACVAALMLSVAALSVILTSRESSPGSSPAASSEAPAKSPFVRSWWLVASRRDVGRIAAAVAPLVIVLCLAPFVRGFYRPAVAARLLFQTNAMIARKAGIERDIVPYLDEARLVASVEGDQSVHTVWRSRGSQLQFRENGIPRGFVSEESATTPHPPADLAAAVLPAALHPAPQRVLLLGAGGGLALKTLPEFPVRLVSCVEPDRKLIELMKRTVWSRDDEILTDDERFELHAVEPALALHADRREWDLIVSHPRHSAIWTAASEHSRAFYDAAARRLSEHGLFVQRFSSVDYGPEPILSVARTLLLSFRDIAVVETMPGELLLIGTNSERGVARAGLLERLQASHIRKALSDGGWDWAVPLTLVTFDRAALAELTKASSPNTVANGRFPFRLPYELMRWAPKRDEIGQTMGAKAGRLATWKGVDGEHPDVLTRLAEVVGHRNVVIKFPDQPHAYRKFLKEQMLKNKTSPIRQISATADDPRMHPVDQHRSEYLLALGKCRSVAEPNLDDLARLERFAAPFDPLVSYFLHYEAAELHARRSARDDIAELRHQLHLAWFADARDGSIRPVVRSLELIHRAGADSLAEAGLDASKKWDQVNGLLQLLLVRWENRGATKPGSTDVLLIDVDRSISAAEKSLATLGESAEDAGVDQAAWEARRKVIERGLIRPLRSYRGRILPHYISQERKAKEAAEEAGDASR